MQVTVVREKEFGLSHDVLPDAPCEWSKARGATHTLLCPREKASGGWGKRAAKLLKTVMYVAVDETAEGNIEWQKWEVRHLFTVLA